MSQLALIIGVIMCLVAYGTDTAPEGTHNIGLMQNQMMLLHTGLALAIAAVIRIPRTEDRAYEPREVVEGSHDDIERGKQREKILIGVLVLAIAAFIGVIFIN